MFYINLAVFLAILLCLKLFTKFWPNKKINLLFLLITFSLLPLITLLRPGDYESGDFNIHIYRSIAFYDSLKEGNIIPSWAGKLNATYGYPLYIFNYTLPYYIVSFFHFLGFSFIASMKIFLAVAYVSSGIFMYTWSKKVLNNSLAAFTSSIFYLFNPYHLLDLHFRVSVGEVTAFSILPLFFYCIHSFIVTKKFIFFLLASFSFYLLFLSHPGTTFFSFYLSVPYILFLLKKNKAFTFKNILNAITPFIFGLLLSAHAWIPYITLTQYTHANQLTSAEIIFPRVWELFFSPWRDGFLFQGPKGELSFLIGYVQLCIVCFSVFSIVSKKKTKNRPAEILWLLLFFFLFLLMTPLSKPLWKSLPFLSIGQFAFRILLPTAICTSLLSGFFALTYLKRKLILYLLITITIGSTMLNWGHRRLIPEIADDALINNTPLSTSQGEALCCIGNPKWADPNNPWQNKIPSEHLEILNGNGSIKTLSRTTQYHEYVSSSDSELHVKENTYYFSGWRVGIDKKNTPIIYTQKRYPGIMTFSIPQGLHYIEVIYEDIWYLHVAKLVSLISLILILVYLGFKLFSIKINARVLTGWFS